MVKDTQTQSVYYHHMAVEAMMARGIPLVPDNYTVWYNYVTGHSEAVVERVKEYDKAHTKYTKKIRRLLYELYIEHSGYVSPEERYTRAICIVLDRLLDRIKGQDGSLCEFTENLKTMLFRSREIKNAKELEDAITDIGKEIGKQLLRNTELQDSLQNHSMDPKYGCAICHELNRLREEINVTKLETLLDELTGVGNRRGFNKRIDVEIGDNKRHGVPFCILSVDIDHFKQFNDLYGHLTGDKVLCFVAKTISGIVKGKDGVFRMGGEEFTVILPDATYSIGMTVADRIRHAISNTVLIISNADNITNTVTVSVGVATYQEADTIETLLHRADLCLYRAKHKGRNKVIGEEELN